MTGVPPVDVVVAAFEQRGDWDLLKRALLDREDLIADYLTTAGATLGGDPAFVAKAILDIGIGRPKPDDVQALINQTFAERLAYYQQMQQQHRPDGGESEG